MDSRFFPSKAVLGANIVQKRLFQISLVKNIFVRESTSTTSSAFVSTRGFRGQSLQAAPSQARRLPTTASQLTAAKLASKIAQATAAEKKKKLEEDDQATGPELQEGGATCH